MAAHWRYKERGESIRVRDEERFSWLKQLMEVHAGVKDTDEFRDSMKIDLFSDEVYTFTPRGDLKVLPRGSTPVDFAYAVHSHIGDHIVGARVDGHMVPLKHQLRNGAIIEILTRGDAHPSADWLEFVVTARAKNKIRSYVHAEERARALEVGADLLEKAFRRVRYSVARAQAHERYGKMLAHFRLTAWDELVVLVGYGKIDAQAVVEALLPDMKPEEHKPAEVPAKRPRKATGSGPAITVSGLDDVMVRMGNCCAPVPGEPIVGVVTRGRGITVHRRGCHFVLDADPMRRLECDWNTDQKSATTVGVRVYCENETGLLAAMSAKFTEAGISILSANCRVMDGHRAVNNFEVVVSNLQQLQGILTALGRIRGVTKVERVRS